MGSENQERRETSVSGRIITGHYPLLTPLKNNQRALPPSSVPTTPVNPNSAVSTADETAPRSKTPSKSRVSQLELTATKNNVLLVVGGVVVLTLIIGCYFLSLQILSYLEEENDKIRDDIEQIEKSMREINWVLKDAELLLKRQNQK